MTTIAKRYPFSMRRYGHNIELAYNHLRNLYDDMKDGVIPWDDETIVSLKNLEEVYANAIGQPVYWATGREYGLLKEYSVWAENYRDQRRYSDD